MAKRLLAIDIPAIHPKAHAGPYSFDSTYYRDAAGRLREGFAVGGPELTAAVATLLADVADKLEREERIVEMPAYAGGTDAGGNIHRTDPAPIGTARVLDGKVLEVHYHPGIRGHGSADDYAVVLEDRLVVIGR